MSDRHSIPVAVDRAYTLWVWLDSRLVDLPAAALDATYAPRGDARRHDALLRANQLGELGRMIGGWLRSTRDA